MPGIVHLRGAAGETSADGLWTACRLWSPLERADGRRPIEINTELAAVTCKHCRRIGRLRALNFPDYRYPEEANAGER